MKKLIFIIAILLVSCSTRKVAINKQEVKIDSISKVEEKLSQVSIKNESLIDTSSCYMEEFEPIDSTQPFLVNGKEYKNVRIKKQRISNGISISKKDEVVLNQTKSTLDSKSVTKVTKDKDTNRFNLLPWWWWVIILISFGGYLIYRKYKR
jgi:uncharacterized protein YcfL